MASVVLFGPPSPVLPKAGSERSAGDHFLVLSHRLLLVRSPSNKAVVHGRPKKTRHRASTKVNNALAKSDEPENTVRQRLQDLADSLVLPPNYLAELPNDLRLDVGLMDDLVSARVNVDAECSLNDAAFDLASGLVNQECGEEAGEILLQLSQAWEKADTQTTIEVASALPSLQGSLSTDVKLAIGKRLIRAGRRFSSMGQYGQGELQKIGHAMVAAGETLAGGSPNIADEPPVAQSRTVKFGTLQVELTSKRAYIGSVVALLFGFLSWRLSAAIESIPENSLQYANDNALLLAKSLRGALLLLFYSCTVLSAFTMIGLFLLGRQASSEGK